LNHPLYHRSKARRSLFDTVTYRVMSQVSTVLGYVVLVRALSKQDFGIFNLLYSFIPLVGTLASLGLEQTLRRFQPEFLRAGNTRLAAWLVRVIARARLGTNLAILVALLLAWNWIAPLIDLGRYKLEFEVFGILALLHFQSQILQLSLASHMLHRFSVGSTAMLSFLKLALYGGFTLAGTLTLRTAIASDLCAYLGIYVFLRIVYSRHCLRALAGEARPDARERRRMIRYGAFNNFNDAGTLFLDSRMDNFFIVAFMNAVSVGIYSFYVRLMEMAVNLMPVRLFDNIIQPMFFAVRPADADERLPQYFTFLMNMNLLLLWPMLGFATAYHAQLVQIAFGGKYVEYSWLLPVILGFATLNCFATPVSLVAQYEEKTGVQLLSKVFAGYNVVAMLVLIPRLGLYGAAIASGSAQLLKNLFVWWHVRDRAVWLNAPASITSGLAMWGGTALVCVLLDRMMPMPALAQVGLGVVLFGLMGLAFLRGPALCRTDRELIARLFPGREVRLLRALGLTQGSGGVYGAHVD